MTREEFNEKADQAALAKYGCIEGNHAHDCPCGSFEEGALWAFDTLAQPWISVEDRLPEKMGLYLISKKPNPNRTVEYLIDVTWFHPESPFNEFVTHWQPLP